MSGALNEFNLQRFTGENGGVVGVNVFFYLTGTTVLADIYSDKELTEPLENPVPIAAGEIIPEIWLDPSITYRRRVEYTDGTVVDEDPLQNLEGFLEGDDGASFVGYKEPVLNSYASNTFSRLRELPIPLTGMVSLDVAQDIRDGTNGSTDFTPSLQALLDACQESGRSGELPETPTALRINSAVTLNTTGFFQHGVQLYGKGPAKTFFDSRVANGAMLALTNSDGSNSSMGYGAVLQDFTIETGSPAANSIGIRLQGQWNSKLTRLRVDGLTGAGIEILANTAGDLDTSSVLEMDSVWSVGNYNGLLVRSPNQGVSISQTIIKNSRFSDNVGDAVILENIDGVDFVNNIVVNNGENGGANDKGGVYIRHNGLTSRNFRMFGFNEMANSNYAYNLKVDSLANGYLGLQRFITNDTDFLTPTDIILGDGTNVIRNVLIEKPMLISGTRARTFLTLAANITPAHNVQLIDADEFQFSSSGQVLVNEPSRLSRFHRLGVVQRQPIQKIMTITGTFLSNPAPNLADANRFRITAVSSDIGTIQAPTTGVGGPREGEVLEIQITNSAGGATAIAWDAIYLVGGFTAPANGKSITGRFAYSVAQSKWVQQGAWSPDL